MDIVGVLTAILSGSLAVIGWFIKQHISSVESDVKKLRSEVVALKQDSIWITNAVKELRDISVGTQSETRAGIEKLKAKLEEVKDSAEHIDDKIKAHEQHLENYGQVIRLLASKK